MITRDKIFILTLILSGIFQIWLTLLFENKFWVMTMYSSISLIKSLAEEGYIANNALTPASPPITNQLGVVYFVFFPLIMAGFDMHISVALATVFAHLNLMIIFFVSYKVFLLFLEKNTAQIYLISMVLSYPIWAFYGAPLNDGFHATFFLIGFLIFQKNRELNFNFKAFFILSILTFLGCLFRTQTIILPAALAIYYLFERRASEAFFAFISIAGVVLLSSALNDLFIRDFSLINKTILTGWENFMYFFKQPADVLFVRIPQQAIGPTILGTSFFAKNPNVFYSLGITLFSIFSAIGSIHLFIVKEKYRLLVGCVLGSVLFLLISPVIINRYIFILLPFLWIILHQGVSRFFRYFHYLVLAGTLFVTLSRAVFIPPYVAEITTGINEFKDCVNKDSPRLVSDHVHFTCYDLMPIKATQSEREFGEFGSLVYFARGAFVNNLKYGDRYEAFYFPRLKMRSGMKIEEWGYTVHVKKGSESFSCYREAALGTRL